MSSKSSRGTLLGHQFTAERKKRETPRTSIWRNKPIIGEHTVPTVSLWQWDTFQYVIYTGLFSFMRRFGKLLSFILACDTVLLEVRTMPTFEKRKTSAGETRIRVKVRLRGQRPAVATFDRLTDARQWAAKVETEMRERRYFPQAEAKRHTLNDVFDRYEKKILAEKKKRTANSYRSLIKAWRDALGELTLDQLTTAAINDALTEFADEDYRDGRPRQAATLNRHADLLRSVLNIAVKEWQWLTINPALGAHRSPEPAGRVRFLSDDERQRLLVACKESRSPDLYPAVLVALATGLRKGELLSLRWSQIDLDTGTVTLDDPTKTKTGVRRAVHVTGLPLELLAERAKIVKLEAARTKLTGKKIDADGELIFPGDIRSAWETALIKADVKNFKWHDLRHTHASYLAMNGATPSELAEALGHADLKMVRRYAHLSRPHMAGVVGRMIDKIFGGEK